MRPVLANRKRSVIRWNCKDDPKERLWSLLEQSELETEAIRRSTETTRNRKEGMQEELKELEGRIDVEKRKKDEFQVELGKLRAKLASLQDTKLRALSGLQQEEERNRGLEAELGELISYASELRNCFLERSRKATAELDQIVYQHLSRNSTVDQGGDRVHEAEFPYSTEKGARLPSRTY